MSAVAPFPRLPDRRRRPAGEERREAILAGIEDLLRHKTLAEINVSDIAAAAGVARSGFYFYFASKGAAVTAMLGDVFAEMVAGATDFVAGSSPNTETVRGTMSTVWRSWHEHEALILATLDARGADPSVRELWDSWIEQFVVALADAVERTTGGGPGPARELLRVLLGANERTFERLSRTRVTPDQAQASVETLVEVWSRALYGTYEPPTTSSPAGGS